MSRQWYYPRHASPYASTARGSPPVVRDEDYHYISQDDIVDPPRGFYNTDRSTNPNDRSTNPNDPDVLFVRWRNDRIALRFPAFSIAEGFLKVGTIRQYAADEFRVRDVRRLKLRYRNRTLRDDAASAEEFGLRQHSEITCIVTEAPTEDGESSADEADLRAANGPRVDVDGTIIRDSPSRGTRTSNHSRRDQPYPTTTSHPVTPSRSAFPQPTPSATAQRPSINSSSASASALPPQYVPPPGPRNSREKLTDISAILNQNLVPLCNQFISNPPEEKKARDMEHAKLSETILAQILLKLDNVDTEGREELRRIRKGLVKDAQAVLASIDKVIGGVVR